MKKVFAYMMIMAVMLVSACTQRTGSGNVLSEVRKMDRFEGINVSGEMSITITPSAKYDVKVTADDNIIKHVNTVVKGDQLYVECGRENEESNITVNILMPSINSIETQGNVGINIKEGFAINDLEIRTFGSGNIDIRSIKSDGAIKILSRGSGNITLSGSVKMFSCFTRDAGNVFADQLEAGSVVAKVGGAGSIFTKTNGNMNVIVAGSGSVFFSGKPSMISKYITGSGSVMPR
jgi:uncharacterized protein YdeI (BOF family)